MTAEIASLPDWSRWNLKEPNWPYWQRMASADLWQCVWLSLGIEPRERTRLESNLPEALNEVEREIQPYLDIAENNLGAGRLCPERKSWPSKARAGAIQLSEFEIWAKGPRQHQFLPAEFNFCNGDDVPAGSWPWGAYTTKLLDDMAAAAKDFWTTYDPENPSTAPNGGDVETYLEKRGVRPYMAKSIATILRAHGAPKGRRRGKTYGS